MNDAIFQKVRTVASDLFRIPPEQVTAALAPADLPAWDSVQHLNLLLTLEEEFAVTLDAEEIEKLKSIGDIVNVFAARASA